MIKMILAHDNNKLIGKDGKLPWHISNELKFFKEMTMGDSLLMGGITFRNLPGKLPGRKHVVFERSVTDGADESINTEEKLISLFEKFKESSDTLWIAGGKHIYEKYFHYASEIYISVIKGDYSGDTYINIELSNYKKELFKESDEFTVYKYTKK